MVYRGTNAVDCRSLRAEYAIQTGNRTFIDALLRTPFELPTSWLFLSSQHVESLREQSRSGDCVFILLSDCIRSVLGYPRSIRYKSALQDIRVVVPGTSHSTTRSLKAVIRIRKGNLGCYSKRQPGDSGAAVARSCFRTAPLADHDHFRRNKQSSLSSPQNKISLSDRGNFDLRIPPLFFCGLRSRFHESLFVRGRNLAAMMKSATPFLGCLGQSPRYRGSGVQLVRLSTRRSMSRVYMYATRIPISTFGCHT